jgi:hypothetical protein
MKFEFLKKMIILLLSNTFGLSELILTQIPKAN